jgi:hypothetical protein
MKIFGGADIENVNIRPEADFVEAVRYFLGFGIFQLLQ